MAVHAVIRQRRALRGSYPFLACARSVHWTGSTPDWGGDHLPNLPHLPRRLFAALIISSRLCAMHLRRMVASWINNIRMNIRRRAAQNE